MELTFNAHRQSRATVKKGGDVRYDYVYLTTLPLSVPYELIEVFFEYLQLMGRFTCDEVTFLEDDVTNKYTVKFSLTGQDASLERDYKDIDVKEMELYVCKAKKAQSEQPTAPTAPKKAAVSDNVKNRIRSLMELIGNRDFSCEYSGKQVNVQGALYDIITARINGEIGQKEVHFVVADGTLAYISEGNQTVDFAFKGQVAVIK